MQGYVTLQKAIKSGLRPGSHVEVILGAAPGRTYEGIYSNPDPRLVLYPGDEGFRLQEDDLIRIDSGPTNFYKSSP